MKYIYLDTSSINFIHDNLHDDEKRKWRDMTEKAFGGQMVFSPISLFEILNSKTVRKDDLIHTCQLLFDDRLLPLPTEILDKYIEKGCPLIEQSCFDFNSDNIFRDVWRDVSSNLDKTVIVHKMTNMNTWTKILERFIKNTPIDSNSDSFELESTIRSVVCELTSLFEVQNELEKVSLFFIILILLIGGLPFDRPELFWDKREISCMTCKIEYLAEHCKKLIYRGPTIAMAMMAINQVKSGKSSRGLFNDCLHVGYSAYCSVILSNDNHFLELSEEMNKYIKCVFLKIGIKTEIN